MTKKIFKIFKYLKSMIWVFLLKLSFLVTVTYFSTGSVLLEAAGRKFLFAHFSSLVVAQFWILPYLLFLVLLDDYSPQQIFIRAKF